MEYIFSFFRPKPVRVAKKSFESVVLSSLNKLLIQGERHMIEMDELKAATDAIAADGLALQDVVRVAMDRIGELAARNDMEGVKTVVKEATASLMGSHDRLINTAAALKAKVDEVSASGGDAS
jgi:vacuolar-type H+-ATPase subunit E/Vma4